MGIYFRRNPKNIEPLPAKKSVKGQGPKKEGQNGERNLIKKS